jgi:D-serine deaminase-like pyridoxal phosphate-dependent protein
MRRRTLLAASIAMAPLARAARTRSWLEVEKILARGDVQGRLSREELPTPALLVDLDALEANIDKMVRHTRAKSRQLRPHGKTHKCPEIALKLMRAGAVGACAAKLSEAEAFARNGVSGLLITTAVVGTHKIERAVRLASTRRDTIFCVDNAQNITDLNDAAAVGKGKLNLALDLYVGNRTGIAPGPRAVALAQQIASLKNVTFAGIQAYAGHASHKSGFEERSKLSREVMGAAVETRQAIERGGISCPLLSGGSTGTYNIDSEIDGVTELQPGSFLFMDIDYSRIGGQDGPEYRDFRYSLSVLTTVVSKPSDSEAVVDGGLKAFSTDRPFMPEARGIEGLVYSWGGDEHGKINLAKASRDLRVGDRVEFIVPHCDPTVNLYDRVYGVRGEKVECVWPIAARGMSQ